MVCILHVGVVSRHKGPVQFPPLGVKFLLLDLRTCNTTTPLNLYTSFSWFVARQCALPVRQKVSKFIFVWAWASPTFYENSPPIHVAWCRDHKHIIGGFLCHCFPIIALFSAPVFVGALHKYVNINRNVNFLYIITHIYKYWNFNC